MCRMPACSSALSRPLERLRVYCASQQHATEKLPSYPAPVSTPSCRDTPLLVRSSIDLDWRKLVGATPKINFQSAGRKQARVTTVQEESKQLLRHQSQLNHDMESTAESLEAQQPEGVANWASHSTWQSTSRENIERAELRALQTILETIL